MERYTSAVLSMTSLLNWWKKLSHVEKASLENISKLILESEQIIAHENNAWVECRESRENTLFLVVFRCVFPFVCLYVIYPIGPE